MIALADVDLVLASTSPYRRDLLARIARRFRQVAPDVDETPRRGESAQELSARLAREKSLEVAQRCPGTVVIGSDQVAELDGAIVGKPGSIERAQAQLAAASGRIVTFHTAVCVTDARNDPPRVHAAADITRVQFHRLGEDVIARYVERERPLDCAGSFKAEGLGIALFERIESQDPAALIGLPLIVVCRLLGEAGVTVI